MKKNKFKPVQLFLLLLMMQISTGLQAQVRVGGNVAPNPNAILDLNVSDTAIGSRGLLLPRVALISTTDANPLTQHIAGMLVFNTATSNDVSPGVYYNDGTKWIRGIDDAATPTVLRDDQVEINEPLSIQSVLFHGEIGNLCPRSRVLNIKGVFSDQTVVKTSFTVTTLLKPTSDDSVITWSLQVQNFNFNPSVSSTLEKIIITYEAPDDNDLTISYNGAIELVGW
jgi:hypothetical protein